MVGKKPLWQKWGEEGLAGLSGGLLLALSFPPFPTRFLVIVALVPLLRYFIVKAGDRSWRRAGWLKRGFVTGYLFGVAFFLTLLYWIANLIPASSARMPWLMVPALLLLVLYLSCYTGLVSMMLAFLVHRFGRKGVFAAPALWALVELARSRGELGFSWGVISTALAPHPVAIQGLALYGPFGLSLVLVLVNVLIAFALFGVSRRQKSEAAAVAVVLIATHLFWGAREITRLDRTLERGAEVAVVQPNLDLAIKWEPAYRDSIFRDIERRMIAAASGGVDLVVFPETAAPVTIQYDHAYRKWLGNMARDSGTDLAIGFIDHTKENNDWVAFNAAGLFSSEGRLVTQYRKVNLLPFGERIPFSQYLPLLGRLEFGQANFRSGTVPTIFESKAGKFGILICFESTFADYTRNYVRSGADFLVNITNDGWFGSRTGPMQHVESVILRAVENRVTLVRAANTGISLHVDPVGRVRGRIDLDVDGAISDRLNRSSGTTLFTRYGHVPFLIMALFNLVAVAAAILLFRRD